MTEIIVLQIVKLSQKTIFVTTQVNAAKELDNIKNETEISIFSKNQKEHNQSHKTLAYDLNDLVKIELPPLETH